MNIHRFQFEMTAVMFSKVEQFQALCGVMSKKEVMNNALTLLGYCIEQKKNGFDIYIGRNGHVESELLMPCLEHVPSIKEGADPSDSGSSLSQINQNKS